KPESRPSAIKICEILTKWQSNENILLELTKFDEVLNNIKSTDLQTCSDDIYESEFIEYTSSLLLINTY
ncbi:2532_t:CDS:1, partial [Cetraspora pellucida]